MSQVDDLGSTEASTQVQGEDELSVPFSWSQQLKLVQKELRETLRDRRTIVTLLAMPLLLYPLLGLGFRFVALQKSGNDQPYYLIAVDCQESEGAWLDQELSFGDMALARFRAQREPQGNDSTGPTQVSSQSSTSKNAAVEVLEPASVNLSLRYLPESSTQDLRQLVADGVVDLAVSIRPRERTTEGQKRSEPITVQLIEDATRLNSRNAADLFATRLEAANKSRFEQLGQTLDEQFKLPVDYLRTKVSSGNGNPAILGLLPLILLLMTVTGGVYPAIDLTAGERERNTLETLVSMPVPKSRLLIAKFVAVVSVTLLTGLMNLLAMALTLYALQLDKAMLGENGLTLGLAIKLLLALSVFGLFYSSVLLMLTSTARSFKEAQAYLIPLLLLSIGPGLVILLPGWYLNLSTSVLPLVNILLLSKQFLEGGVELLPAFVAIISTILYGMAALGLASSVFGNDAVAVGSRGKLADILRFGRESRTAPSPTVAMVGLAALFPAYFFVSGALARQADLSIALRLILAAVLTALLFLVFPMALLKFERIAIRQGLSLLPTSLFFWVGAILLGCSTWPWIFEIVVTLNGWGLGSVDLSKIETVEKLLESWKQLPLFLIVFCLGVVPGICEECFFRGFLFNGIRQNSKSAAWTIFATAIAFGLFHVVLSGGAAPERVLPSTLMGVLLGWVRAKSGSILPGIVLHSVHNSALLILASFRDELAGWGLESVQHQSHLPTTWLGIAAVGFILGAIVVYAFQPKRPIASAEVGSN